MGLTREMVPVSLVWLMSREIVFSTFTTQNGNRSNIPLYCPFSNSTLHSTFGFWMVKYMLSRHFGDIRTRCCTVLAHFPPNSGSSPVQIQPPLLLFTTGTLPCNLHCRCKVVTHSFYFTLSYFSLTAYLPPYTCTLLKRTIQEFTTIYRDINFKTTNSGTRAYN